MTNALDAIIRIARRKGYDDILTLAESMTPVATIRTGDNSQARGTVLGQTDTGALVIETDGRTLVGQQITTIGD